MPKSKQPKHRWEVPDFPDDPNTLLSEDFQLSRYLPFLEELDIAAGPRMVKNADEEYREEQTREARADRSAPADLVPMRLVSMAEGVPVLTEQLVNYIAGEPGPSLDQQRMRLLVEDFRLHNGLVGEWLYERVEHQTDYRAIARKARSPVMTIYDKVKKAKKALIQEFVTLYGYLPSKIAEQWQVPIEIPAQDEEHAT